jgi:hypothetical protein
MQCPKCGLVQDDAPECKGCGIIIAKFKPRSLLPETPPPIDTVAPLSALQSILSSALDRIKRVNWMPFVGYFGVGWAILRISECHQEVRESGWSYLISTAAVVALFVTLMHHWIMMEEANKTNTGIHRSGTRRRAGTSINGHNGNHRISSRTWPKPSTESLRTGNGGGSRCESAESVGPHENRYRAPIARIVPDTYWMLTR